MLKLLICQLTAFARKLGGGEWKGGTSPSNIVSVSRTKAKLWNSVWPSILASSQFAVLFSGSLSAYTLEGHRTAVLNWWGGGVPETKLGTIGPSLLPPPAQVLVTFPLACLRSPPPPGFNNPSIDFSSFYPRSQCRRRTDDGRSLHRQPDTTSPSSRFLTRAPWPPLGPRHSPASRPRSWYFNCPSSRHWT